MNDPKNIKSLLLILNDTKSESSNFILQLLHKKKLRNYRIHVNGLKLCHDEEFLSDINVIQELNIRLFLHKTDLKSDSSVKQMFDDVIKIEQKIDVLVCHLNQPHLALPVQERCAYLYEQNFYPHVRAISNAVQFMKNQEQSGRIIVVNNHAGRRGLPFYSAYCSTRFAIEGFLESVAVEVMSHDIRVNIIETVISKEDFLATQSLDNLFEDKQKDSETKHRKDSLYQELEAMKLLKSLTSEKLVKCIQNVIVHNYTDFRYYANLSCQKHAKETRVDYKGTKQLAEVGKFFLNMDVDDLRFENEIKQRTLSTCSLHLRDKILS